jgi:hypothetical protein
MFRVAGVDLLSIGAQPLEASYNGIQAIQNNKEWNAFLYGIKGTLDEAIRRNNFLYGIKGTLDEAIVRKQGLGVSLVAQ